MTNQECLWHQHHSDHATVHAKRQALAYTRWVLHLMKKQKTKQEVLHLKVAPTVPRAKRADNTAVRARWWVSGMVCV